MPGQPRRLYVEAASSIEEFERPQRKCIAAHDRETQEPIPDHISARAEDLKSLLEGVVAYRVRAVPSGIDPVVAVASMAFPVRIHLLFEDGNGRLHRWLIHHVLATAIVAYRTVPIAIRGCCPNSGAGPRYSPSARDAPGWLQLLTGISGLFVSHLSRGTPGGMRLVALLGTLAKK